MKHAINELTLVLETARNNEPIQRAEGRVEEADYNLERIDSITKAIQVLNIYEATEPSFGVAACEQQRKDMVETNLHCGSDDFNIHAKLYNEGLIGNPQSFGIEGRFVTLDPEHTSYLAKPGAMVPPGIDSDQEVWDELDPKAACKLDNLDCESCS